MLVENPALTESPLNSFQPTERIPWKSITGSYSVRKLVASKSNIDSYVDSLKHEKHTHQNKKYRHVIDLQPNFL
jgi:hypothetical protein